VMPLDRVNERTEASAIRHASLAGRMACQPKLARASRERRLAERFDAPGIASARIFIQKFTPDWDWLVR
jgi:hypothetical protein